MSEPFIGEIVLFAGNFAPRGWAFCNGTLLAISSNSALFSIIGTTYGGNGTTTFALPDLRSRVPVHSGQGPGLPFVQLGEMAGSPTVTLLPPNLPAHVHSNMPVQVTVPVSIPVVTTDGDSPTPGTGKVLAQTLETSVGGVVNIYGNGPGTTTLEPFSAQATVSIPSTGITGSNYPVNIQNPFLGLNYIIATSGIYPSRN